MLITVLWTTSNNVNLFILVTVSRSCCV